MCLVAKGERPRAETAIALSVFVSHRSVGAADLLLRLRAAAVALTRANKEANDEGNEEHEDPGEDDDENGNPQSYPPVDGAISIEEGGPEPH